MLSYNFSNIASIFEAKITKLEKKKKEKERSKHRPLDDVSDQVHAVHGPSTNLDAAGVSSFEHTLLQFSWRLQLIIMFYAIFHINGSFANTVHSPPSCRLSLIGALIL